MPCSSAIAIPASAISRRLARSSRSESVRFGSMGRHSGRFDSVHRTMARSYTVRHGWASPREGRCTSGVCARGRTGRDGQRPSETLRWVRGGAGDRLPGGSRRGVRLPGAQRRREVDHHQHALHPCQAIRRLGGGRRVRRRDAARRRTAPHRPRLSGHDTRPQPHRCAEPADARGAVRGRETSRRCPHGTGAAHGGALGPPRSARPDLLGRDAPPSGDRPRPHALPARAVPR